MEPDFASVWSRVTGASLPEAPETQLRRFLISELETAGMLCAVLSLICDATLRKTLTELHQETVRQIKRIRAALYLLAGECECTQPPLRKAGGVLPALKELYDRVGETAAAYRTAAAFINRPALETLYSTLADEKLRQAEQLLRIVERLL